MKKILLTMALLTAAVAQAQNYRVEEGRRLTPQPTSNAYVSVGNNWNENRVTGADSISPELVVGIRNGNWQYSGKAQFSQQHWGEGAITNTVEARVRYNFDPVTGLKLKPFVQGRVGEQLTTNSDMAYYAVDLGLGVPLAPRLDLEATYRYRNAFRTENNFETDRYGIEAKYKLSRKDTIGVRYTRSYGDTEVNGTRLQYTRSF